MGKSSGKGFVKNLANFNRLIKEVKNFDNYAPSVQEQNIADMEAFAASVVAAVTDFNDKEGDYKKAVGARQQLFKGHDKFVTRINRSFRNQVKDEHAQDEMEHWLKKTRGERIGDEPEKKELGADDKDDSHSVSQRSYEDKVEHFAKIVALCTKHAADYKPNEADLKLVALQARHAQLDQSNASVDTAFTVKGNSQRKRHTLHYADENSIYAIGSGAKDYVISAYGFDSPEAKIVNKISFTR